MELKEWVEEVRQLLYEVAHQENELGVRAECLGSFIPDLLNNLKSQEQTK